MPYVENVVTMESMQDVVMQSMRRDVWRHALARYRVGIPVNCSGCGYSGNQWQLSNSITYPDDPVWICRDCGTSHAHKI